MKVRKYNVDLLKTIAIIMVVACHSAQKINGLPIYIDYISQLGQLGVQIFFVMSAYLCCVTVDNVNVINKKAFLIKKFLRVAPAYWFAIIFYQVLLRIVVLLDLPVRIYTNTDFINCLINIALLNNLFPSACNTIVPGGWSISCLWIFFLLFPYIFKKNMNYKTVQIGYIISCIFVMMYGIILVYVCGFEIENNSYIYFSCFSQFPCFATGILLYFFEREEINLRTNRIVLRIFGFSLMTIMIFFVNDSFSFIVLPWCTSLAVMHIYIWLDKNATNIKEQKIIIEISNMTLSFFVVHPVFAYYGVSYTLKVFERVNIVVDATVTYIVAFGLVFMSSFYTSRILNSMFVIPMKIYRKLNIGEIKYDN